MKHWNALASIDRLLFAQASTESLQLLTADALLVQYGPPTVQV